MTVMNTQDYLNDLMKTKAVAYMINGDDIKNKLSFLIIISVAGVCVYMCIGNEITDIY